MTIQSKRKDLVDRISESLKSTSFIQDVLTAKKTAQEIMEQAYIQHPNTKGIAAVLALKEATRNKKKRRKEKELLRSNLESAKRTYETLLHEEINIRRQKGLDEKQKEQLQEVTKKKNVALEGKLDLQRELIEIVEAIKKEEKYCNELKIYAGKCEEGGELQEPNGFDPTKFSLDTYLTIAKKLGLPRNPDKKKSDQVRAKRIQRELRKEKSSSDNKNYRSQNKPKKWFSKLRTVGVKYALPCALAIAAISAGAYLTRDKPDIFVGEIKRKVLLDERDVELIQDENKANKIKAKEEAKYKLKESSETVATLMHLVGAHPGVRESYGCKLRGREAEISYKNDIDLLFVATFTNVDRVERWRKNVGDKEVDIVVYRTKKTISESSEKEETKYIEKSREKEEKKLEFLITKNGDNPVIVDAFKNREGDRTYWVIKDPENEEYNVVWWVEKMSAKDTYLAIHRVSQKIELKIYKESEASEEKEETITVLSGDEKFGPWSLEETTKGIFFFQETKRITGKNIAYWGIEAPTVIVTTIEENQGGKKRRYYITDLAKN